MMANDQKKEVNLKELINVKDNSFLLMDNISFVKDKSFVKDVKDVKDKDQQRSLLLNSLLDVNTNNPRIINVNNNVSLQREFN